MSADACSADTATPQPPSIRIPTGGQPDGARTFSPPVMRTAPINPQVAVTVWMATRERDKISIMRALFVPWLVADVMDASSLRTGDSDASNKSNRGFESDAVRQRGRDLPLRARELCERRPFHGLFRAQNDHHAPHNSAPNPIRSGSKPFV